MGTQQVQHELVSQIITEAAAHFPDAPVEDPLRWATIPLPHGLKGPKLLHVC